MSRIYNVFFEQVLVAAAQDLVQIKCPGGKMLRILRQWWGPTDTAAITNQNVSIRSRFLPTSVTDGSGGTAPTPQREDPGDAAASFTALANNTTKATTSGTPNTLEEHGDNVYSGYDFSFPDPPPIGPSESFVFELLSAPSGTLHISGGVRVEEIGG